MPLLTMKQIMADSVRLATSADAKPEDRYAVGAFNFSTIPEMVGIVEGAREKNAPVILMASLGAIKYIGSLELDRGDCKRNREDLSGGTLLPSPGPRNKSGTD